MSTTHFADVAFDENGAVTEPAIGVGGRSIVVYKTSLHLRDVTGWYTACGFVRPIVAVVRSGYVQWGGFHVYAERGPDDDALYAFVVWFSGEAMDVRVLLACSVYSDDGDVPEAARAFLLGEFLERARCATEIGLDDETVGRMRDGAIVGIMETD